MFSGLLAGGRFTPNAGRAAAAPDCVAPLIMMGPRTEITASTPLPTTPARRNLGRLRMFLLFFWNRSGYPPRRLRSVGSATYCRHYFRKPPKLPDPRLGRRGSVRLELSVSMYNSARLLSVTPTTSNIAESWDGWSGPGWGISVCEPPPAGPDEPVPADAQYGHDAADREGCTTLLDGSEPKLTALPQRKTTPEAVTTRCPFRPGVGAVA